MIGFLRPVKYDCTFRDWAQYSCLHNSICCELNENYGFFSRMLLTHESVFFALLSLAQQELPPLRKAHRCKTCWKKFQRFACSPAVAVATHISVLLTQARIDDWAEDQEHPVIRRLGGLLLARRASQKATECLSAFDINSSVLKQQIDRLRQIQKTSEYIDLESITAPMAEGMAYLIPYTARVAGCSVKPGVLEKLGFELGRILHLLDFLCDSALDAARSRYNPLVKNGKVQQTLVEETQRLAKRSISMMQDMIETLELYRYHFLIQNIFFVSLPMEIESRQNVARYPMHICDSGFFRLWR